MFKLTFLFLWLSWLLGNPFFAIILLLFILYVIDRRFVGLSPSLLAPLKRNSRIRKLRNIMTASPNDVSAKQELARLLIDKKKYGEAIRLLEPLKRVLEDSAEYWADLGLALAAEGNKAEGEAALLRALEINSRVKYGTPYLRLAAMSADGGDQEKALRYLRAFQDIHSSSCESYYRLAEVYKRMGKEAEAKSSAEEGLRVYRSLPKYRKRAERGWALRLLLKK
ncbi:lipopolysaccharide assembly protein LapB [Paenibacillus sp. PAMC21692]|uniref:tetratricopeptide repeat protein n=1 Tax=Paenibacillus sp. PAMC21692 TaxID=2762320 RepID=UPI00164CEFF8|nr:tetratricopeptide repeat protein [Paenibacillus sp. PAMC21692]QNK56005.1 tetratricopeptide repeat protein [Paenibacillus sp. PAMC21692]